MSVKRVTNREKDRQTDRGQENARTDRERVVFSKYMIFYKKVDLILKNVLFCCIHSSL
jgi:hypothetical protein